ncbi:galactosyltransferase-related protein [uncultured Flavobacterium sp.]|uniref:glycosyltransferase family 2 protein n=1 Tax=uncultured Flavobacterium sp. TaxID=165435 RepID=UPI0027E0605C|nr:galactosyltransferase-related protein [uncultured Flavobacterium sp.]
MITLLYPYRNREIQRIQRSMDSLAQQKVHNFNVVFIDYGSEDGIAAEAKAQVEKYDFASYVYLYAKNQPWNKCKALNYAIKKLEEGYCFVADVDMIFHPEFTCVLEQCLDAYTATYFQVGFLSESETKKNVAFESYQVNFKTNEEATGMTLFPVSCLKKINGFDEFFHFWGAEDTDIHNRLKNAGCKVNFYDKKLLMLHQWHPNYRQRETKTLNKELQLSGIVEINQQHLFHNQKENIIQVNPKDWGNIMDKAEWEELQAFPVTLLSNEKQRIDYFLYQQLPNSMNGILAVEIKENPVQNNFKYRLKKKMGKKVPQFYSLKEINDQILLHIVSFYHTKPYIYQVKEDLKTIIFKIKT